VRRCTGAAVRNVCLALPRTRVSGQRHDSGTKHLMLDEFVLPSLDENVAYFRPETPTPEAVRLIGI
jgi:hypothetical protein